MKLIYKVLSGIILSIIATIAIAGLVSFSNLVKPEVKHHSNKISHQQTQIKIVHKEGICHHNQDNTMGYFSFSR
ncbi:MAG: hypothetical protein DI539_21570 [Flavobacterium psychrophilum]|nr:MAG: hypothetical protein DI539_21570 [Flavobacterium psychrophilum]